MFLESHAQTDVGQKRDHNEDHFVRSDELGLYIVCDGMGGHAAGEVASALAAKTIVDLVQKELGKAQHETPLDAASAAHLADVMRRAGEGANTAVYELGKTDTRTRGSGTTCTALCIRGGRGVLTHVGDSRLYLLRSGELHQLSFDHSFVAEAIRRGVDPAEAEANFPSNLLTRAIGPLERIQVDTLEFEVIPHDVFLLCSDGLHGYFPDAAELAQLLAAEPAGVPQQLVQLANDRGGADNITCIVVRTRDTAHDAAGRMSRVHEDLSALSAMELFSELTYPELLEVAGALRSEERKKGEVILGEGDVSRSLYVIASGTVEVRRGGTLLTTLGAGSHFGEMALLTNRPRSATIRTTESCRLLALDQEQLYPLFQQSPVIGVKFLWKLSQVQSLRLDEATLWTRPGPDTEVRPPRLESTQELFPPPFSRRT